MVKNPDYSSSGISDSLVSLQLNCKRRKFVISNAPKTIKKVTILNDFVLLRCRKEKKVAFNFHNLSDFFSS